MKEQKRQQKCNRIALLPILSIFGLLLMALLPTQGKAQNCGFTMGCNGTDYTNYGFNSSTPGTLEYDNFISNFHATTVRNKEGKLLIWGEKSSNTGGNLEVITEINKTNFPALGAAVPLKAAMGSYGNSSIYQRVLLASDGLYVWGTQGGIIHSDLTTATTFAKLAIGLPSGVNPADVKMMFATYHTLAIVTCNGDGWVLTSEFPRMRGDGTSSTGSGNTNLKTWARVKTGSSTNLTNIVAIRGNHKTLMALTSSNEVYTWGEATLLGTENNANQTTRDYATKMTLPNTNTIKMIGVTNYYGADNDNNATYYVLYADGKLYAMGNNQLKQLGDGGTSNSPSSSSRRWVQPTGVSNIKWISPNEHDPIYPAINVITSTARIYNWGTNAGSMLGRTSTAQTASDLTSFDPGQPLDNAPFAPTTSDILGVETGGHTTMIVQKCQEKFGYVGHFTNGSATGNANSFYPKIVFNTAKVEICGIESGVVDLSLEPNGAAVTIGVPVQLTYAPAGGTFQVTSGNATVTSTGVLTPIGPGEIKVSYTVTGVGACTPNSVTITISANKVKINANDDFNAGVVKTLIPGNVKTNDNVLNATYGTSPNLVESPTGSTPQITMNADGTYEFKTDKPGIYTYDVVVCPQGQTTGCPTTKLIITVTDPMAPNDAANKPHADLDLGTTKINKPITLDIVANDGPGNIGKTLTDPTITGEPSNGSAEIVGGKLVYTPNTGFTGKDTVTYQVCDTPVAPAGNCATAIAIITVLPDGTNTTSAADDYARTPINTAVSGNVKANDVDIENHTTNVTAQTTTVPGKGTLVLNTNGTYTFTPETGFVGTVDLPYTICDTGTPQACANATLHIVVYNTVALSVVFGDFSAQLKDGQLLIDWSTLKETNNDRFEIEASVDGINFTKIGEVISKAKDGNSGDLLNYEFSTKANDLAMKFGISFMLIGGLGLGFAFKRRRNKFIAMAITLALTAAVAVSCNKANDLSAGKDGKLFIRIAQVDKNGVKQYSKVVQAIQK